MQCPCLQDAYVKLILIEPCMLLFPRTHDTCFISMGGKAAGKRVNQQQQAFRLLSPPLRSLNALASTF
eukprot:1034637-Pelagomonas_calceolata.AAC.1